LVISCGSPQINLYRDARHQGPARVAFQEAAEKLSSRVMGVNAYSYHVPQARRMLVYTEYFREYLVKRGVLPRERIDILPICLPATPPRDHARTPRRVGFVAQDFVAKGGDTLVAAWRIVRGQRPD